MRKLLKHEWIATGRTLLFVYLSCVLAAGLYALSDWLNIAGLVTTSTLLLFIGMAAAAVITLVLIIQRFFRSVFGAEGYLTKTLPVSPRKLLLSKLIVSYIWLLLCYVLILSMLALFFATFFKSYAEFEQALDLVLTVFGTHRAAFIQIATVLLVIVLIQNATFLISIMCCITVGHLPAFNKNNGAVSFGAYVAFYAVTNILKVLLTLFLPLSLRYTDGGLRLTAETLSIHENITLQNFVLPVGGVIFELLLSVALFFLTARMIEGKTSVRN